MSYKVVILSASVHNLIACVDAICKHEPNLDPQDIIVVWDGDWQRAEYALPAVTWIDGAKPFQFSRNANIGIRAAGDADVILCCDDAILQTPGGFTAMVAEKEFAITSPSIVGVVANSNQYFYPTGQSRFEPRLLCFICVLIRKPVWKEVGEMDERFTGYGYEDNDYCRRAVGYNYSLGVTAKCVVEHESQPSVWRTNRDITTLLEHNRRLYLDKWGQGSL